MLKHQLNQVCSGDKIYLAFLDELDTVISSRGDSSTNSFYQKQKLGELMKFLDGEYPNQGNYLVIATSNDASQIDRALKNARMERLYCPGPRTAEEKAKVIAVHFGDDLQTELVDIRDWKSVGVAAHQAGLNGRQIRELVSGCYDYAQKLTEQAYDQIYTAATLGQAQSLLIRHAHPITDRLLIEKIAEYATKDVQEAIVHSQFNR